MKRLLRLAFFDVNKRCFYKKRWNFVARSVIIQSILTNFVSIIKQQKVNLSISQTIAPMEQTISQTKQTITQRVENLRKWLKQHDLQAYIIPSTDPHASEYTPSYWQCRQWVSGFEGSAGTAVVTLDDAQLWTDSRYFIAAQEALEGTPFGLMKERVEGTPTIAQWLAHVLGPGAKVGIDGKVYTYAEAMDLQEALEIHGIKLVADHSAPDDLWVDDRPPLPDDEIVVQPLELAGESLKSKVDRLMKEVEKAGCDQILISQLDEVAWLLNLRGNDVHCNPVFVAYCIVSREEVALYCNPKKIGKQAADYLSLNGVKVYDYYKAELDLMRSKHRIMLSPLTNVTMAMACLNPSRGEAEVVASPLAMMKAVKNMAEIKGMKRAMLQDGVALVKWLRWLEEAVPQGGQTEMTVDEKLTQLRKEFADFQGLSFDTIAGYNAHGAIVHYEATPETDAPLKAEGILLVDTGAQYTCGTTDITRTLLLGGQPTDEQKKVYTLVLKGHIGLSSLKFPRMACGTQLDLAARSAMWAEGYNFGHGTGHGVGAYLNVHEGPHQIRMNYMPAPIIEGMTVTDEPGLYLEGRFGVRIENVLLCVPFKETEFGAFVGFLPLTLCPIEKRLIDLAMLTPTEVAWLNDYHLHVKETLLPHLTDEADRQWLTQACAPL